MKNPKKILLVSAPLIVVLVLVLIFVEAPNFTVSELTVEEKARFIMTELIGLDMEKYEITLHHNSSYTPENFGGFVRESVAYTLDGAANRIRVFFTFLDGTMTDWSLDQVESSPLSPLYVQPLPANTLDVVKDALKRYQSYSGASTVQEARNILGTITELKPMNTTIGDLKMRVTERNNDTIIDWVRTINGFDFPLGLSIRLTDGVISSFNDQSRFYKIGSSEVNISQGDAIRIALAEAKTFRSVNISLGHGSETFPFHVKEEPWTVRLQIGTANFTSYPYWYVWFVADPEVYSVTGVEVYMRADTGEIAYSRTTKGF